MHLKSFQIQHLQIIQHSKTGNDMTILLTKGPELEVEGSVINLQQDIVLRNKKNKFIYISNNSYILEA